MEEHVYLKKAVSGYYVTFPEALDEASFTIGSTYQDFLNGLWIRLSEEQVKFHGDNPGASVKETIECKLTEPEEAPETVESLKQGKLMELRIQDGRVNEFTVNGSLSAWLTPEERSNYKNSIESAKLLGIEELSLFLGDTQLKLPVQDAERFLAAIQIYADQCYIQTRSHEVAIKELKTKAKVKAYDVTTGYPEKLNFTV